MGSGAVEAQRRQGIDFAVDLGDPLLQCVEQIERLWGVMHKHVTHNKSYATCAQFADATLGFLWGAARIIETPG